MQDSLKNSCSNTRNKILTRKEHPVQSLVRNSKDNIKRKILSSIGLPGMNSLPNSWVKFEYKMQHSTKQFGMH